MRIIYNNFWKMFFVMTFICFLSCKNNDERNNWIYGTWKVEMINNYELQLFSSGDCKLLIDPLYDGWMDGKYEITESTIEVSINETPIMFSLDRNEKKIFTVNGTKMNKK